jgi:hypothetical protein
MTLASLWCGYLHGRVAPFSDARLAFDERAIGERKLMSDTFIAVQVGAISFIDEGVEEVLDTFKALAGVNAICVSALSWSRGNAGRAAEGGFPDHGVAEPDELRGGAFFKTDPRYYQGTSLRRFAAPDRLYEGFNALGDVIGEARRRDIAVLPYYCETAHATPTSRWQPGFFRLLEIDSNGRIASRPCLRNPAYRSWWFSVIENWINEYDIDGVMWGIERQGPLSSLMENDVATCFCPHCTAEASQRGIDARRAVEGFQKLESHLQSWRSGERARDGHFITFHRVLLEYPEILQWEKMWVDAHKSLYREISGLVRFHGDQYQVGFGLWQMIDTFNPWLRAEHDPGEYVNYADWIKPVLYNVPAGARFTHYLESLCQTVLGDAGPAEWFPVMLRILGLEGFGLEDLPAAGFPPKYVTDFTARYVAAVGGKIPVYPGLGVGMEEEVKVVTPADVEQMVEAAFEGGASGIVISRNYSEMQRKNLAAVGSALKHLRLL